MSMPLRSGVAVGVGDDAPEVGVSAGGIAVGVGVGSTAVVGMGVCVGAVATFPFFACVTVTACPATEIVAVRD
jgi:hypothetical protein